MTEEDEVAVVVEDEGVSAGVIEEVEAVDEVVSVVETGEDSVVEVVVQEVEVDLEEVEPPEVVSGLLRS